MTIQNAEQEFLNELQSNEIKINDDSQIIPPTPQAEPKEETSDSDEDSPRNRRERRFVKEMERIRSEAQKDREARIKAEERARAILELDDKSSQSSDPDEMKFYNLDTPEGRFSKSFLDRKFKEVEDRAYTRAMEELRKEQELAQEENQRNSQNIDRGLDLIEEKYNVDLSGDTKSSRELRNGYLDFVSEISPKDENGDIIEYADFDRSFDIYRQMNSKKPSETSQRQKAIADRSMASTGQPSAPQGSKFRSGRELIDYMIAQQN